VCCSSRFLWIGGVGLAACTAFSLPFRTVALTAWMLCVPLLDPAWQPPSIPRTFRHTVAWIALALVATALLVWRPRYVGFTFWTVLITALPEEWFFRAYFMTRLGTGLRANLIASAVFALMHGLIWGRVTALLVFIPSLFYGWLYQRVRDLPVLVLVHALSNLVYMLFLVRAVEGWLIR